MASPAGYEQGLVRGLLLTKILYGSNWAAGASVGSMWRLYADAAADGPPDPPPSAMAPSAWSTSNSAA